ncbi:hypothetical protein F4810DRAFT_675942 [Camillea tinctor]|nr:hypothetical protein F4810DRAFT_675942 [Camillea tinctor]
MQRIDLTNFFFLFFFFFPLCFFFCPFWNTGVIRGEGVVVHSSYFSYFMLFITLLYAYVIRGVYHVAFRFNLKPDSLCCSERLPFLSIRRNITGRQDTKTLFFI